MLPDRDQCDIGEYVSGGMWAWQFAGHVYTNQKLRQTSLLVVNSGS